MSCHASQAHDPTVRHHHSCSHVKNRNDRKLHTCIGWKSVILSDCRTAKKQSKCNKKRAEQHFRLNHRIVSIEKTKIQSNCNNDAENPKPRSARIEADDVISPINASRHRLTDEILKSCRSTWQSGQHCSVATEHPNRPRKSSFNFIYLRLTIACSSNKFIGFPGSFTGNTTDPCQRTPSFKQRGVAFGTQKSIFLDDSRERFTQTFWEYLGGDS